MNYSSELKAVYEKTNVHHDRYGSWTLSHLKIYLHFLFWQCLVSCAKLNACELQEHKGMCGCAVLVIGQLGTSHISKA